MAASEHEQVFGLRCTELGDQPGETHDFILVSDADEYVREIGSLKAKIERLRGENATWRSRCGAAEYEHEGSLREVERLREALQDSTEYVRLGMTWIEDSDRHAKMKRAWERAREALDSIIVRARHNPDVCSVCGCRLIGPHEGDQWCPRCA